MKLVTVLTTTYNRAYVLPKLYESLKKQTINDFEWLIVDDGSTDNTQEIVHNFQKEEEIVIKYIKKENGGKHTALNVGIREINTILTIIVDSDDILLPDAIENINKYFHNYKLNTNVKVFSFLRCNMQGIPLVKAPKDEFIASYVETRIRNNLPGDMAEVFYTDVLKEFPFPEFEGEKFLSEDIVWIKIGLKYDYAFINIPIYKCEYLEDGLTINNKNVKFQSPKGSMLRGKVLMLKECGLKTNIKGAIIYNCYREEVKDHLPECLKTTEIREKILICLTYLLGKIFNNKWKKLR